MSKTIYITTPIYYPSANLHIGNAYTTVIADVLKRYFKQREYDVYFLTGTDEHGEKIAKKAAEKNLAPIDFVTEIVLNAQRMWQRLHIDNDDFLRTTQERHKQVVSKVFSYLLKKGDIYLGRYEGFYCTPCEAFWTPTQAGEGVCPDCQRGLIKASEESYFFKMSNYADQLMKFYQDHPDFIDPIAVKKEMINNFLTTGLQDLCISRTSFSWGIPVPDNPKHVVYVWLDALLNYVSALGYLSDDDHLFKKFWRNDEDHYILHLLGKEITRFHTIYWPIFLMALDLPLPSKILAHGWLVLKDGKMSKSKGNLIDPNVLIDRYGADTVRYFLAKKMVLRTDNLYSNELFLTSINQDLVNDLGNLLRRTTTMVDKYFASCIPDLPPVYSDNVKSVLTQRDSLISTFIAKMDAIFLDEAFDQIFQYLDRCNKLIEITRPWELAKSDTNELAAVLFTLIDSLRVAAVLLAPVLVELSPEILRQIGLVEDDKDKISNLQELNKIAGKIVQSGKPLIARLDIAKEVKELDGIGK